MLRMPGVSSSPLVTIVTPSLDQGRFLADAIESVLGQDYPHVEYLILDGGSTDESAAVAARYAGRLTFVQEPDRGQSHAINKGFARARGEIVQWLNADDWLAAGAIRAAVEAFRRAPAAAAVYGHGHPVDVAGRPSGEAFRAPARFELRRMRRVCDTLAQPSVFLRRAAVLEVGGLDEGLHWSMDWDLYLRLGSRFAFVPVDRELAVWRDHLESKTRSGAWRRFRELARVARRHTGLRFPPAFFLYLAQTVEYLALARGEPRLARAARALQWRIWKRTMQWYPDGWVGPRLDLELAREPGRLRLSGELPPHAELCPGQRLTVLEGGRIVAGLDLGPGRFEHTVEPAPGEGPVRLALQARRSFVPGLRCEAPDDRWLAYRLHEVAWTSGAPAERG
jgi:glycosyltransferase involved in cell wall biosynthesis